MDTKVTAAKVADALRIGAGMRARADSRNS
jgi:hypothetical protein